MIRVNNKIIEQNHFPDGTLLLKTEDLNSGSYYNPTKIEWFYDNDGELFTIICLAKKAKRKNLYLYYLPNARQDRVKSYEDTFTLKYFAEVINALEFESVTVLEPHSSVSEALINNIKIQKADDYVLRAIDEIGKDVVLFYPDEGACKRNSGQYRMKKFPYAFGIKKRNWSTGQIQGLDVIDNGIDLKGKTILIVDDICSRGGTFYHAAKKLKEIGVGDIYLYVSHCENTILEGEVLNSGLIEKVFTTNSIFNKEHKKIEVFEL